MMASRRGMNVPAARVSPPTGLSLKGPGALLSDRVSRARLLSTRPAMSSRELRLAAPWGFLQVKGAKAVCCRATRQAPLQVAVLRGLPAAKVARTCTAAYNRQQALTAGSTAMDSSLSSMIMCCTGSNFWQTASQCASWHRCRAGQGCCSEARQGCCSRSAVRPLATSLGQQHSTEHGHTAMASSY